jgi:hypothetical protein
MSDERTAQLVASLGAVRTRLADACASAGRDVRSLTLIAVTKTYPAEDVATLVRLGVSEVGESRDQEAAAKVARTAQLLADGPDPAAAPRWHFVGQLQRRKSRSVARYAFAVHSVDRPELVDALADGVTRLGHERAPIEVFVQISLDGDPERGGVVAEGALDLAARVAAREQLHLRGVMAVAPMGVDPAAAFARLAEVSARVREQHPHADAISAGMSNDLEQAIEHGATHVRVGTALLGRRGQIFS